MKLRNDYSDIRGVCHYPDASKSKEQVERELGYAERLQINSIRFWLRQEEWEADADGYFELVLDFIRRCNTHGISVMPIFWNGNSIASFTTPTEAEWKNMEEYAAAVMDALKGEPNILMWDVMNEPYCNDYIRKCPDPALLPERMEHLQKLVRRMCGIIRGLDPDGVLTVGHELISHCESTVDLIDVISFHDYLKTRAEIEAVYTAAEQLSQKTGKPLLNTETGCIGRSNPYDLELEICSSHKVGWYLFQLMVEGSWGDIHGIVYPDGTIRDPAIVAAMFGFYRKHTPGRMRANPNKEGYVYGAVEAVEQVLRVEETALFQSKRKTTDDILEAAERCVNILESNELVPMWNPPSAQIADWRAQPEAERDLFAIKKFAYDMAKLLRESCLIL
ncbi:MAG: cellulase family glycosylhydrolase [Oscillospiraceae bacterium]|jgi:hypothetical protein